MADPRLMRSKPDDWPMRRWVRWRYFRLLPMRSELRMAWWDARAWLIGYCNDCPVKPTGDDRGGGYRFWRCALKRRHAGEHRAINYVWDDAGHTRYEPTSRGVPAPSQPRPTMVGGSWWFRVRNDWATRPGR